MARDRSYNGAGRLVKPGEPVADGGAGTACLRFASSGLHLCQGSLISLQQKIVAPPRETVRTAARASAGADTFLGGKSGWGDLDFDRSVPRGPQLGRAQSDGPRRAARGRLDQIPVGQTRGLRASGARLCLAMPAGRPWGRWCRVERVPKTGAYDTYPHWREGEGGPLKRDVRHFKSRAFSPRPQCANRDITGTSRSAPAM
jgi:hypothetical protein